MDPEKPEDRDRNNDFVPTKLTNTGTVMEDDVGVENEYFFLLRGMGRPVLLCYKYPNAEKLN